MLKYILLIMMLLLTLLSNSQVKFGERPPINIENVNEDSYENNRIKIKISEDLHSILGENIILGNYVRTENSKLNELNDKYKAISYRPLYINLYEDARSKTLDFKDKHKEWGFHLWYEIEFEEPVNIINVIKEYSKIKGVIFSEPEYKKELIWTPNDPQISNQWHYNNTGQQGGTPGSDIDLFDAWETEKGSNDIIVAIIDGGIQIDHVDLAANMWTGIGYNFVTNSSTIQAHNHGTHVAGTVSAVNNNGIGVSGVAGGSGTGDGVRLMSCQVFTSSSSGGFHLAPIYAADNGAVISQNSWGYTSTGVYDVAVLDAIDYFNINGGGDVLYGGITIFAAGNSNSSGQWYPGCYSGAFSVAATNNQDKKAWYSNYDTWVDVSAPGGETNVIQNRGVLSTLVGNTYGYYQGTSMACPHVSGIAALMISLSYRNDSILSNDDIKNIIKNTTDDHYYLNASFIDKLGTGRVNAKNALLEIEDLFSNVPNPTNFNAQGISIEEIYLNWNKNINNDSVIIAWKQDNIFGDIIEGSNYNIGDTIPGGGNILYKGIDTIFIHSGLNSGEKYYYKIWSYNNSVYSSGRMTSGETWCEIYYTPFFENFNDSNELPTCWENIDNIGNGQVWKFGRGGYMNGTVGNYAYLNSDAYGSGNSQNADLVTPTIDLTGRYNVQLSFTHRFRAYSTSNGKLYYSINNGTSWVLIQTWNTNTLNPDYFNIIIPELNNQPQVKFKWKYTGTWAYYWSVDDIEITSVIPTFWQGISSNWNDVNNWNNGIPDSISMIIIPNDVNFYPVLNNYYNLNEIIIEDSANITLNNNAKITINNIINNNIENGVNLKHGSSLICDSDVIINYEKPVSNNWDLISSPTQEQEISNGFLPGYIFTWYDPAETWVSYNNTIVWPTWLVANDSSLNFIQGKGYFASYSDIGNKYFKGNIINSDVNIKLNMSLPPYYPSEGWNIIGNPFTSYIDWKSDEWERDILDSIGGYSMWTWNSEYGNYGTYNSMQIGDEGTNGANRYILPTQGFWVKSVDTGYLNIKEITRTHNITPSKSTNNYEYVKVRIYNDSNFNDEILIELGHNYDMGTKKRDISNFTIKKNNDDWIICLLKDYEDLRLEFISPYPGKYKISTEYNLNEHLLFLIDEYDNDVTNGSLFKSEDKNYFYIYFKNNNIKDNYIDNNYIENENENNIVFYNNYIDIDNRYMNYNFKIFDMNSRLIYNSIINNNIIKHDLKPGVYIFQLYLNDDYINNKFVIY